MREKRALFCPRARASGCAPTAAMAASTAAVATIAAPSAQISFGKILLRVQLLIDGLYFLLNPPMWRKCFPRYCVLCNPPDVVLHVLSANKIMFDKMPLGTHALHTFVWKLWHVVISTLTYD